MQNQVFIPCQSNGGIPDFSLHSFCIKGQVLKAKYFAIVGGGRLLKAPEHCFNPHQKLLIVEWLCDVIICTISYEVHFAVYIRFSGHTDNRNIHRAQKLEEVAHPKLGVKTEIPQKSWKESLGRNEG